MKRILLCAAILALPAQVAAQHVGLQAGGALTSQTTEEADAKFGPIGGVSLDLPLLDAVGARLGALYAQKGASFDVDGVEGTNQLTYIELPAMLRLGGSVYALIGAAIGINSGCMVTAPSMSVDRTARRGVEPRLVHPRIAPQQGTVERQRRRPGPHPEQGVQRRGGRGHQPGRISVPMPTGRTSGSSRVARTRTKGRSRGILDDEALPGDAVSPTLGFTPDGRASIGVSLRF